MVKPAQFEVIAGTYEEFLLGYKFSSTESTLSQSFAAHDHASSIRCVHRCDHYVATGSADNHIFVYDLKSRTQICMLVHHEATVNCVQFTPNHSHLFSGSADGVLACVRLGNWQVEKIWAKAHKGFAILDIAVHPSGKLALTLGADCTLCTWNLIKGRQAYIINLMTKSRDAKSLERIVWAEDGVRFLLYGGKFVEVWSIELGGVLQSIEFNERVVCCIWLDDDCSTMAVGLDNGQISIIDDEGKVRTKISAHSSRVKNVERYRKWLVSASSNGEIALWSVKDFREIARKDTGCRLTCLCVMPRIKGANEEGGGEAATATTTTSDDVVIKERAKKVKGNKFKRARVVTIVEDGD